MKRIVYSAAALALLTVQAHASAGFSCETAENEKPRVLVEGATPRSGGTLINFGAVLELEDRKIEFKQSDVKRYYGVGGVIQVRVSARSGDKTYTVNVSAKRNPKDEDDWSGTYEVTATAPASKDKIAKARPEILRGKVKCFVE